jgi:hypothetical protein
MLAAIWRRTPTRRDGDQPKMISRGRARLASSLVPEVVGAPVPGLARRPVHGGPAGAARRARRNYLGAIRSTRHISNPVFKCPACGHVGRGADPTSMFAPQYWPPSCAAAFWRGAAAPIPLSGCSQAGRGKSRGSVRTMGGDGGGGAEERPFESHSQDATSSQRNSPRRALPLQRPQRDQDKLTSGEELFALEYLANGGNGAAAYRASHPKCRSDNAAVAAASRMLRKVKVQRFLAREQATS